MIARYSSPSGVSDRPLPRTPDRRTIRSRTARKVYFGLVAVGSAVLFILAPQVFLLFFCCVLFALLLAGICELIEKATSLKRRWSLTLTVSVLLAIAAVSGWLLGPQISEQFGRLSEQLPQALALAREKLSATALGAGLVEALSSLGDIVGRAGSGALIKASTVLSSTVGLIVQLFVIFFVGLYLASDPDRYVNGFAKLFPPIKRPRVVEILGETGSNLKRWILGRLILMGSNGVVTAIGLHLLGIPLAIALGVISALLNFVPNFGPWLAAIPAVLLALAEGPSTALYVAAFYLAYQMFDGYVLTPLVEGRTATIPSAIVLMSQVLFGVLFGALGVVVAVPLAAVIMVLLREVHVKDALRDPG
jgi:predicted PurR-regulated permease PerM